ncbi:MAG: Crp/Fnr family transcriptional regulator [Chitinophagaceae bacterium]|nr:MAG: Crp/Fnr family transcriptional regulator [Chitinophagaceae bacterium]
MLPLFLCPGGMRRSRFFLNFLFRHFRYKHNFDTRRLMQNQLLQYLSSVQAFSSEELEVIGSYFSLKKLLKEEYLLREGQVCNQIAFIEKGLLLYTRITDSGEEKACDFAKEQDWVTQYNSFITRTPSALSIKALEETEIYTVSFEKLNALYDRFPPFERIARQLIERFFIQAVQRTDDLQNLGASARYEKLLNENPAILQRVPQYFIASYLGITPQSLSRIRKK